MENEAGIGLSYLVEPFRLEGKNRQKMEGLRQAMAGPWTSVGERLAQSQTEHQVFQVYDRTMPVFSALINLIEFDEIDRYFHGDFFKRRDNQRLVIKALTFKVEESMAELPFEGEMKSYYDYKNYYEGMLTSLKIMDRQIERGVMRYSKIVDSLTMIFIQNMRKLEGVLSFDIKKEIIRKKIADYIPILQQQDDGRIIEAIREKFHLTPQDSVKA